ncbi:MAG: polysaccharide biosynthesis protein [Thermodesulfobacteriota bacterium]
MKIVQRLLAPTSFKRFMFFFLSDLLIIVFSLYFSFYVRFDFALAERYRTLIIEVLPLFIIVKMTVFSGFRLRRITWKYVGLRDFINITAALALSEMLLAFAVFMPFSSLEHLSAMWLPNIVEQGFPRSIFIIDGANSLILFLMLRISKRLYLEVFHKNGGTSGPAEKTLIIGAGNAGEMILRDMSRHGFAGFNPVGLLDDDRHKINTYMHGIKVLGRISDLRPLAARLGVQAVIIAIPSLNQKTLRSIFNSASEAGMSTIKIIPRMYDVTRPEVNLRNLESIKIEDLLGRQVVEVDYDGIKGFLNNRRVLITGAGGSIGTEITMQACACGPASVVLLDVDETELHNLELRLKKTFPHLFGGKNGENAGPNVSFVVADVRDKGRIESVFKTWAPQIVFHAAAYKHVPMMEYNPNEAVKVNMFGTYNIADASAANGVEKFVMISTDKAVRPTSVMGASKRMAENICRAFDSCSSTEFVSVRFGNVLGSRGSVLPLFLEQLKHGGPLTVTHRDMKRYFMTIPEAVSLVLQSSVIGRGGEVLVLDMGDPMRIVDLAEELIRIHGLEPHKDVDIEFIEPRPGEKLFEEILTAEEGTTASRHRKIFIARNSDAFTLDEMDMILAEFEARVTDDPEHGAAMAKELMRKYVRHFDETEAQENAEQTGPERIKHLPVYEVREA